PVWHDVVKTCRVPAVEIINLGVRRFGVSQPNNRGRKPKQDASNFLERATESFQENVTRSAPIAAVSYTLIGAIIFLGGIGFVVDKWRGGSSHVFLVIGLILGIVVGFVDLARFIWKR